MPEIVEPIVESVGLIGSSGISYTGGTNTYDIAIAGLPFFLAASQQYPYKRETAPYRRTQIDQTREPGEQTLTGWWLRSQSSFHLGAGVKYQEPVQGDTVGYRFWKSAGIDPWQTGKVTLLRDVEQVFTSETGVPIVVGASDDGANILLIADGDTLWQMDDLGELTELTWGGTGTILALAQDGANYYAANSTGVYKGAFAGSGSLLVSWGTTATTIVLQWAKQRLMAGVNNVAYEIVGSTKTAVYTHPISTWVWTGIAEGPNSIYFAGYCGTSSSVIRLALDTSGTLPTLTNALTAAYLPGGEYITAIATYLGKYVAIGTNLGVRIGTIDTTGYYTDGYITYGPLMVTTNGYDNTYDREIVGTPVTSFTFDDRFVYATVTNFIDNGDGTMSSGLIRIDLSREVSPGAMAWATDLRTMTTDNTIYTTHLGVTDRKVISTTAGVYLEKAYDLVPSGYLQTGQIRYLTLEDKHFKLIKPRMIRPMTGNVQIMTVLPDGTLNPVMTIDNSIDPTLDITTGLTAPAESVAFRFKLYRDETDDTKSSTFTGYQLKSLPAVRRARLLTIPLMNYDYEEDRYNVQTGYEGRAGDRILQLETVEASGDTILIQDFTLGETVQAVIESTQFIRITPPERRFKGFGGVLYVTARTV